MHLLDHIFLLFSPLFLILPCFCQPTWTLFSTEFFVPSISKLSFFILTAGVVFKFLNFLLHLHFWFTEVFRGYSVSNQLTYHFPCRFENDVQVVVHCVVLALSNKSNYKAFQHVNHVCCAVIIKSLLFLNTFFNYSKSNSHRFHGNF